MVGNVDVHGKFSMLKGGKYTNFIRTMNVFSLAASSSMLGCMFEVVYSECLRPESE